MRRQSIEACSLVQAARKQAGGATVGRGASHPRGEAVAVVADVPGVVQVKMPPLSPQAMRVLSVLTELGEASAGDIGRRIGTDHRNVRDKLALLQARGLAAYERTSVTGSGREAHIYRAVEQIAPMEQADVAQLCLVINSMARVGREETA